MLVFIAVTFGIVFYLTPSALPWFFVCLFFLGIGGADFAVYTLCLPVQHPTGCRAVLLRFPLRMQDSVERASRFWLEQESSTTDRWEFP